MTAPELATIGALKPGARFGILGSSVWVPCEFVRARPAADGTPLLVFRMPPTEIHPSGFETAFWPGDLVLGENLRPADECAFVTTCPQCAHAGHGSNAWIDCSRCQGTHLVAIDPWRAAA